MAKQVDLELARKMPVNLREEEVTHNTPDRCHVSRAAPPPITKDHTFGYLISIPLSYTFSNKSFDELAVVVLTSTNSDTFVLLFGLSRSLYYSSVQKVSSAM